MGFDDIAATHIVGPVFALHEDMRKDFCNEIAGFVFVENNDKVDNSERSKNEGTVAFKIHRAGGSLGAADGCITIEAHYEGIALRSGKSQILGVSTVEDVKTSVCEDERLSLLVNSVALLPCFLWREETGKIRRRGRKRERIPCVCRHFGGAFVRCDGGRNPKLRREVR